MISGEITQVMKTEWRKILVCLFHVRKKDTNKQIRKKRRNAEANTETEERKGK
jgi:hypothetical protein